MAQKSKGGAGGILISLLVIVVLCAAGIWVARENNIKSLSDVWAFATKKSNQFDQCLPEDMINDPANLGCSVDANGNPIDANGNIIGTPNSDTGNNGTGTEGNTDKNSGGAEDNSRFVSTKPGVYWAINGGNSGGLGASAIDQAKASLEDIKSKLESIGETLSSDNTDGYHDKDFKRWVGTPCSTRDSILRDTGVNVVTDDRCNTTEGTWVSPYDNKEVTNSDELTIDHIVPLKYAYQHGASNWDDQKRTEFANDKDNLVAVTTDSYNAKNGQSVAQWTPENKDAQCDYVITWVNVAYKYGISLDKADKEAINKQLQQCQ